MLVCEAIDGVSDCFCKIECILLTPGTIDLWGSTR